ncbi:Ig-like domain-containing protein, partial [Chitinivorax tropicus]|uniref:Ig-like domain-containing protein n=1 Tax=Chitinivorax tropicus TaxID=714531 RepID=UPI0016070E69
TINGIPLAGNDQTTVSEDSNTVIQVLINDRDPDGDTLVIVGTPTARNGTVTLNPDGTLSYRPNLDYHGKDTITYTITDGKGGTATGTVDVTVTPVNDNPRVADGDKGQQITTNEDTPIQGKVTATDIDGDTLTYTIGDRPSQGTVSIDSNGNYTYTPAADYFGKDRFTVVVDDGKGGKTTLTIDVNVLPINDAPIAQNQSVTTPEDQPISGKVFSSDGDGDTLTVSLQTAASHGTVTVNADGTYTYVPNQDFNGNDRFTVTVSDGQGGVTTATIDVTVTPVEDPAIISGTDHGSVTEDTTLLSTGQLTLTDPDAG